MKPFLFTLLIILGSINCYCQKLSENESIQSSPLPIVIDNKIYGYMIQVPEGSFLMGSNDREDNEKPPHMVTVNTFYIGETEVTQELWMAVMGSNPSYYQKGDNYPVENVSWNDCQTFIKKLNDITGKTFRLPTEAEWEYAARGGKSGGTRFSGSDIIDEVAMFYLNSYKLGSGFSHHPVKSKKPNTLGIYDMSGNVWEWCQDSWDGSNNYTSTPCDGSANTSGPYRVFRGGSWYTLATYCRVAYRDGGNPDGKSDYNGLRLVLVP